MLKRIVDPSVTPDIIGAIEDFITEVEETGSITCFSIITDPVTGNFILVACTV